MRGLVVVFMCMMIVTSGCLKKGGDCQYKNENKVAPVAEEQAILSYLTANSISATKHGSNMYYEVVKPGAGVVPGLCSSVLIKYAGKLTNGTQFDSSDAAVFTLGSLIEGWKVGLPLIKAGGEIRLYIPPSLGYGSVDVKDNNGAIIIPANSILIFTITLLDVQ
jgi:FKBP-type peptidyl-prolyl cis-trans isomerase FkpA